MTSQNFFLKAQICSSVSNRCEFVEVKLPQNEVSKLQYVATLKAETIDYSAYSEFFFVSFSVTLVLWLFAKSVGIALSLIKRA